MKEMGKTWQSNAVHDPELTTGLGKNKTAIKVIIETIVNLKCGLNNSIVSVLNFLILIVVLWLIKRMSLILGNVH